MAKEIPPELQRLLKSHLEKLRKVKCAFSEKQHSNPNYYCVSLCIDPNCAIRLNGKEEICRPMCLRCLTMKHRGHTQITLTKLGEIVHTKSEEEQKELQSKKRVILEQYNELEVAITTQLKTLRNRILNSFNFKTTYTVLKELYEKAIEKIAENPLNPENPQAQNISRLSALDHLGNEVAKKLIYQEPREPIEPQGPNDQPEDEFIIKDYQPIDKQDPIVKIDQIMNTMKSLAMDICQKIAINYNSLQDYIEEKKSSQEFIKLSAEAQQATIVQSSDQLKQLKTYFEKVKNDLENEKKRLLPPQDEDQLSMVIKSSLEYTYRSFSLELAQTIALIDNALKK